MNKVEGMHTKASMAVASEVLKNGGTFTSSAINAAHGQVTEDVACKFAEWVEHRYKSIGDGFYMSLLDYNQGINDPSTYTISELYQEFIKTL